MKLSCLFFVSFFSALALQGCGDGGGDGNPNLHDSGPTYSGLTTEANIDTSSSIDLTNAAVSGGAKAVEAFSNLSDFFPSSVQRLRSKMQTISPGLMPLTGRKKEVYSAKPIDISDEYCPVGGSAIEDINESETESFITFRDCDDGLSVINGTESISYIPAQDSLNHEPHVSVSIGEYFRRFDWTAACADISSSPSCEISSDFIGNDLRLYRLENASITGDEYFGYNITATVYDPDHGRFDMTTSGAILYDCDEEWIPSTGVLSITGSGGGSAIISFDSCSQYTVTAEGVGITIVW